MPLLVGWFLKCSRGLLGFFCQLLLIHVNFTWADGFCTFLVGSILTRVLLVAALTLFGVIVDEGTEVSLTYLKPSAAAFIFRNSSSRCNFCHLGPFRSLRKFWRFSICSRSQAETLRTGTDFLSYFFFRGLSEYIVLFASILEFA